eukprot:COSAG01_NODE_7181_length_3317_cov_1.677129_2_plen_65_part_00
MLSVAAAMASCIANNTPHDVSLVMHILYRCEVSVARADVYRPLAMSVRPSFRTLYLGTIAEFTE